MFSHCPPSLLSLERTCLNKSTSSKSASNTLPQSTGRQKDEKGMGPLDTAKQRHQSWDCPPPNCLSEITIPVGGRMCRKPCMRKKESCQEPPILTAINFGGTQSPAESPVMAFSPRKGWPACFPQISLQLLPTTLSRSPLTSIYTPNFSTVLKQHI